MNRVWTEGVAREVLPNGLTVLVQRESSAPVAAVATHVRAGFFDEPDPWVGISHVLEHMYFKGTSSRGVGAIARETKAAGGYLNASTTYDHTLYFAVLPAANLAQAVAIQADALCHSAIDADELARELRVIIQEAKRKQDTPSALTHETLHEVMFDRHRIRRWRIGYEADLARFTRDDVWGYYRSRYVPERTIVAIVGDVQVSDALALVRQAYGDWPPATGAVDPSPAEPWHREVRTRTLRGDVTQGELTLGWRAVPPLDPDAIPLDLAAAVLATGRGSWLYRALRETGLATSVSAYNFSPTEVGVFSIGAEFDPERLPLVIERIAEEVNRLVEHGPVGHDLERARTLLLTRWARRIESMEGRAAALAGAEALTDVGLIDREFNRLAGSTGEEVRTAAARYLGADAVGGVLYQPRERGLDLSIELLHESFARRPAARTTPSPAPLRLPRARTAPASRESAGVLHTALPGVDLLVRRKSGVPTVTLGLYVPRAEFDPPSQAGLGALAIRSAVRGAGALDAAELAFAFERLGGTLASSVALDWLGFSTTVLAEHLPEAAGRLELVFSQPRFEEEQVLAERSLLVEETAQVTDDMFRFPFQLAFAAAFGGAGYGLPALGLPETLRELGVPAIRDWYLQQVQPHRAVVIAVGDIDPPRATADLAAVFHGHPVVSDGQLRVPTPWALTSGATLNAVPREKAQSALAMAFPGPNRRDPRRAASEVWSAVASGLGGRLFEALRDRRSLAYTVMASSWQRSRGGAFVTYIATSPEREEEARAAMIEELARFALEPVSPEELSQATNYLAGQAEVNRQSGSAVAAEVLEAWLAGEGLEELADPGGVYRHVTAEEVREAAAFSLGADGRGSVRAEGVVRGTGGGR